MTVSQLIRKLQKLDRSATVVMVDHDNEDSSINCFVGRAYEALPDDTKATVAMFNRPMRKMVVIRE